MSHQMQEQSQLVELVIMAGGVVSAAIGVWGRIKATTKIHIGKPVLENANERARTIAGMSDSDVVNGLSESGDFRGGR